MLIKGNTEYDFEHAKTAQLLWHVQICDMI